MDTIFISFETSKTSDTDILLPNLSDKIDAKRSDKYVALSNLSIYCASKNRKNSQKNNKLNVSAPTWRKKIELPDGSYLYQTFKIILNIS